MKNAGYLIAAAVLVILVVLVIWFSNDQQLGGGAVTPMPTSSAGISPTDTIITQGSSTPSPEQNNKLVTISLVSLENEADLDDTIGCGDSLVSLRRSVQVENKNEITAALIELFTTMQTVTSESGIKLYNSLSQSNLSVESVEITGNTAEVNLQGQLRMAGTCDNPRVEQQIISTVKENSDVENVEVNLNGQTLSDVLDQR